MFNIEIDYMFYLTNQVMKPVSQIFSLIMDKPDSLFDEALRYETNKRNKVSEITTWFS